MQKLAACSGEEYDILLKRCRSYGRGIYVEGETTWLEYVIGNKHNEKDKNKILNNFWHWYKTKTSAGATMSNKIQWTLDNRIQVYIQSSITHSVGRDEFDLAMLFSSNTDKKYGVS